MINAARPQLAAVLLQLLETRREVPPHRSQEVVLLLVGLQQRAWDANVDVQRHGGRAERADIESRDTVETRAGDHVAD